MPRAVWLPFAAGLLQVAQPAAGGCLPRAQVAERMDDYFTGRRAPATYRALAGMGDPRIEPYGYGYYREASQFHHPLEWEERNAIHRRMLPPQRPDPGYWQPDEGSCRLDYASWVARERIGALGSDHPYVRQWFAVQRAVFEACINRSPHGARPLPAAIPLDDPRLAALQSEDRAYQQASRLFYEKSPGAPEAFRRIAASKSRHAPIARYMMLVIKVEWEPPPPPPPPVPRTVEAGGPPPIFEVSPAAPKRRPPDVAAILAEAKTVLADPRFAAIHPLTQALVGSLAWNGAHDHGELGLKPQAIELRLAHIRLSLEALRLPLERLKSDPVARERYARAAADIEHLQRHRPGRAWLPSAALADDAHTGRALAAAARADPVAGWLIVPPSPYEELDAWAAPRRPTERPLRRYLARHGRGEAWLTVRMAHSESYDPRLWRRLDRQARTLRSCAGDQPLASLATLYYHQVRTALMYGGGGAARRRAFAQAVRRIRQWPWRETYHHHETLGDAADYLVARGRLTEARRLLELVPSGPKPDSRYGLPALLLARDEDEFAGEIGRVESGNALPLFNRLSIAALSRLAAREDVPAYYRALFARTAWTRLYASGKFIAPGFDRLMRRLNPEIAGGWRSTPGGGADDKRLLLDVLGSPGLNILMGRRPDPGYPDPEWAGLAKIDTFAHSDHNWWCAWQPDRHRRAAAAELHRHFLAGPDWPQPDGEIERAPRRLRAVLRQSWLWRAGASEAEQQGLARIDCAPKLLAERAIRWARAPASAEGQDEALALAIRATRYGCQRQGGHGAYSSAAFALLHRRFPQSPAAKRTPYWFDCSHFYGGCPVSDAERSARPD